MGTLRAISVFLFAFAQCSNATLDGTGSDANGALIPGVTVTATAISNETGAYQIRPCSRSYIKLTADLSGFRTQNL